MRASPSPSRVIVGDIGGTNARLRLLSVNQTRTPRRGSVAGPDVVTDVEVVHAETVPRENHDTFEGALQAFLQSAPSALQAASEPTRACFAVAGIVRGNRCDMTNCPWVLGGAEIASAFNFGPVRIINDFEAVGYGVAALLRGLGEEDGNLKTLLEGEPVVGGPVLVLGTRDSIVWPSLHSEESAP